MSKHIIAFAKKKKEEKKKKKKATQAEKEARQAKKMWAKRCKQVKNKGMKVKRGEDEAADTTKDQDQQKQKIPTTSQLKYSGRGRTNPSRK